MEFAVIQTGGKQYKVSKDSVLSIEKMSAKDASASGWEVGEQNFL